MLEFNHGNDELSVPYANLIETGQTYKGEVIITPTQLIGRVEGVADVSITRTDTQLAEWENQCWFGGFEETLSPLIVGDFKVKDYVITPPPNGLVVVDGETLTGQAGSSAYYTGSATFGSLTPPVVVGADTIGFIYTLNEPSFGGKITDIGNDDGITGTSDLLLSFDGQEFRAVYGNGGWRVVSDVLYDYLQSKWNTPINFTAEIAPPSGSRLKVVEADAVLGGSNTTAYLSATAAGQEYGQLIPPVVIDGMAITFLYTLNDGNDIVVIGNDFDGYPPLKCTFDGQEFILNTVPETPTPALVALLNDAKDAGREIDFTAEIASDFADNGDFANNGDFA
ncbi:MAG: hypothetical protein GY918_08970 [Gammaproteobacteria bacterium]|nr:hypothetical protein [Gammaproteobacteria bacterium]